MTVKPMKRAMQTLVLTVMALGVSSGAAQSVEQITVVSEHVIPNTEGKSMVVVVVTYPQGVKSPPHHHAASAFIYARVLSGAIRSQVDNEPPKIYQVGEGFYEELGHITGSVKTRVTAPLRAYLLSSLSIPNAVLSPYRTGKALAKNDATIS